MWSTSCSIAQSASANALTSDGEVLCASGIARGQQAPERAARRPAGPRRAARRARAAAAARLTSGHARTSTPSPGRRAGRCRGRPNRHRRRRSSKYRASSSSSALQVRLLAPNGKREVTTIERLARRVHEAAPQSCRYMSRWRRPCARCGMPRGRAARRARRRCGAIRGLRDRAFDLCGDVERLEVGSEETVSSVAQHIRRAQPRRRDDRHAGDHRLEQRQRHAFEPRRHQHEVGAGQQRCDVVAIAEKAHAIVDLKRGRQTRAASLRFRPRRRRAGSPARALPARACEKARRAKT